ncbi:hypothetical protein KM043_017825 [Ampulex compressa]|nr:hypothetical protein KM043_017825 [Ampulex compressa]
MRYRHQKLNKQKRFHNEQTITSEPNVPRTIANGTVYAAEKERTEGERSGRNLARGSSDSTADLSGAARGGLEALRKGQGGEEEKATPIAVRSAEREDRQKRVSAPTRGGGGCKGHIVCRAEPIIQ